MYDDELADLLGRATAGGPQDDLTATAWHDGRRRARRQSWTVGSLGAVAGVTAIVGAWSLGGGSTDAAPGPADSGGVDDMAVTSIPPGQEMVPYRVVFEVTGGVARPDGPVEEWSDVAGVTLQATEVTVETDDGLVSAAHRVTPLVLGGPVSFRADGSATSGGDCSTMEYAGGAISADGLLTLDNVGFVDAPEEECQSRGGTGPADLITGMHGTMTGSELRRVGTEATLTWDDGALVATGEVMHEIVLPPSYTDEGPGQRTVMLAEVPQSELRSMDDFPSSDGVEPEPGTGDAVTGEWHVLDLRGLEPAEEPGPTLSFDGEQWSILACGLEISAEGTVIDGEVVVTGPWTNATVDADADCPTAPWKNLDTWQQFLDAEPQVLMLEEGRYRGLMLLGELP